MLGKQLLNTQDVVVVRLVQRRQIVVELAKQRNNFGLVGALGANGDGGLGGHGDWKRGSGPRGRGHCRIRRGTTRRNRSGLSHEGCGT